MISCYTSPLSQGEGVVVYIITRSLLIYPSVSMIPCVSGGVIPCVSGDTDEASKGACPGASAGQVSAVFWGKNTKSVVYLAIKTSHHGYRLCCHC